MSCSSGNFPGSFQQELVNKYLFANEKKIYNEIKYVTETKYINLKY